MFFFLIAYHTYITEGNLVANQLLLPTLHNQRPEVLIKRSGIRQKPTGKQYISNKPVNLRREVLARFGPANTLARETVDQGGGVVHLATTRFCVVQQGLFLEHGFVVLRLYLWSFGKNMCIMLSSILMFGAFFIYLI